MGTRGAMENRCRPPWPPQCGPMGAARTSVQSLAPAFAHEQTGAPERACDVLSEAAMGSSSASPPEQCPCLPLELRLQGPVTHLLGGLQERLSATTGLRAVLNDDLLFRSVCMWYSPSSKKLCLTPAPRTTVSLMFLRTGPGTCSACGAAGLFCGCRVTPVRVRVGGVDILLQIEQDWLRGWVAMSGSDLHKPLRLKAHLSHRPSLKPTGDICVLLFLGL